MSCIYQLPAPPMASGFSDQASARLLLPRLAMEEAKLKAWENHGKTMVYEQKKRKVEDFYPQL